MEMAHELLITREKLRRIDKATIVKLAIDYIKAYQVLCKSKITTEKIENNIDSKSRLTTDLLSEQSNKTHSKLETAEINDSSIEKLDKQATGIKLRRRQATSTTITTAHGRVIGRENQGVPSNTYQNIYRNHEHRQNQPNDISNHQQQLQDHQQESTDARLKLRPQRRIKQPQQLDDSKCKHLHHQEPSNDKTSLQSEQTELPMPKVNTGSIFAPRTDDMDSHYLMISECEGRSSFVLKPDDEILDEDDLTHLAPQAGDLSVQLDVEPLDEIVLDYAGLLFYSSSPPTKRMAPMSPSPSRMNVDKLESIRNPKDSYAFSNVVTASRLSTGVD